MGAEVILDLHKLNGVYIRRMNKEKAILAGYEVAKVPTVLIYSKNDSSKEISLPFTSASRESVEASILSYLNDVKVPIEMKYDDEKYGHERNIQILQPQTVVKSNEEVDEEDELYQLDLDSALQYSLNNEIPKRTVIENEKLQALKLYLTVLAEYFPGFHPSTKEYLQSLKKKVESKTNITGKDFKNFVKEGESKSIYLSAPRQWKGCKGSDPSFRGYSCGLWTLFHTLTVQQSKNHFDDLPPVLTAMLGFVKQYFGCTDCSEHFQNMSRRRNISKVSKGDESILWLWRAHNEVNERLAGDKAEDPQYPKIQYPSKKQCAQCREENGEWKESEVLKYLKRKYSETKEHRDRQTSVSNSGVSHLKFVTWDFTIFDISLCVMLYVASTLILVLVFVKFAVKRTHKKRVSLHNFLGLL